MDDQTPDSGNTEIVLPIICPNCKKEINLGMFFALLDPDVKPPKDHVPEEKEKEGA